MIHEDENFPWDEFDNGEDVVHDDRLDDLSVLTQDISYEGIPDSAEVVTITIDTTRRTTTIYQQDVKQEIKSFVTKIKKDQMHGRCLRELFFVSLFHSYLIILSFVVLSNPIHLSIHSFILPFIHYQQVVPVLFQKDKLE